MKIMQCTGGGFVSRHVPGNEIRRRLRQIILVPAQKRRGIGKHVLFQQLSVSHRRRGAQIPWNQIARRVHEGGAGEQEFRM